MRDLVLYSRDDIPDAVERIARDVVDERRCDELVVVCILKGGTLFAADLVRSLFSLGVDPELDFLWLSRYHGNASRDIFVHSSPSQSLDGKDVLLVDDVLDRGRSMQAAVDIVKAAYNPSRIRTAVLVDKPSKREVDIEADFVGFTLKDDVWIAGYGMDDHGRGRGCSHIFISDSE